jgi:hypothetical protein
MNRYQKSAWFSLVVIATAIIAGATAITIELYVRKYSTIGWWFFVVHLASLQLTRHLFRKAESPGGVVTDERDELILKNAVARAWMAFWWVFVALCFVAFLVVGPRNSLPTIALPLIAIGAGLFLKVACSVAILVQYGRGGDSHE